MKYCLFIPMLFSSFYCFSQAGNPVADPKAIVIAGNARFTLLTPEAIRMEWSRDKKFTDEASQVFINRNLPVPFFTKVISQGKLFITTNKLFLEYSISADSFSIMNLKVSSRNGNSFMWQPGMQDTQNLKGTMRTLDGKDGGELSMLENGIISKSGWSFINDSKTYLFEKDKWIMNRGDTGAQDWYLLGYGHDYKKALKDFTMIAGKIPMPPRYAFGYWWSRYWIYGEKEMKSLITTFKQLDIPIDVMIIDMDWHDTYNFRGNATVDDGQGSIVGWTGYTWNRNIFPEPQKFLQWMEDHNIKNALNLHPAAGIPPMEERYNAFAKAYSFDTTGRHYIPYNGSDKKWSAIYFDSILHPLEKMGVDFWWLDWQQFPFDRRMTSLSNTWWLNHLFFKDMQKQGRRPLLFHRWGGLGNHRYQVGFSGDTYTTWKTLSFQPAFTATASNVGYGYWSHDIGGHQISAEHPEDIKDGELFLRWMQFGAFSPVLRTHSTKKAEIDRRFWNFKNEYPDIVDLIKLRYTLNPYIYTAARMAYDSGISLCHPLYYDHPAQKEAYQFPNEYYFGDKMIVAPIVTRTDSATFLAKEKIWLPEGEWEEWFTGNSLAGNKIYERSYSKTEVPVFVKAGSLIPLFPGNIKNLQHVCDTVVIQVFNGNGNGSLYEDDGKTDDYQMNRFAITKFTQQIKGNNSQITISPAKGSYKGMMQIRTWIFVLNKTLPPASIKVNGNEYPFNEYQKPGTWTYSGDNVSTIITLKAVSTAKQIVLDIRNSDENSKGKNLLEGYKGFVNRMKYAMEKIKFEISAVDWGAAIPDPILNMESLPVRIQYHQKNTVEYLRLAVENKNKLRKIIMDIPDVNKANLTRISDFLDLPVSD